MSGRLTWDLPDGVRQKTVWVKKYENEDENGHKMNRNDGERWEKIGKQEWDGRTEEISKKRRKTKRVTEKNLR